MMVTHYMEHYFKEDDPHVFARDNEEEIINEFNRFVDRLLIKFSWHTSALLDISHYAVEVT